MSFSIFLKSVQYGLRNLVEPSSKRRIICYRASGYQVQRLVAANHLETYFFDTGFISRLRDGAQDTIDLSTERINLPSFDFTSSLTWPSSQADTKETLNNVAGAEELGCFFDWRW